MEGYIVYLHKNKINNKKYVGITCQNVEYRWRNGNGYRENKYFTNAIRKYGWDNFEHLILAKGLTLEEASEYEREYIKKHNLLNRNIGYNISDGGSNGNVFANFTDEEKKQWSSKISKTLTGKYRGKNSYNNVEVICITTNTVFYSLTLASNTTGSSIGNITKCCKGQIKSCGKASDGTPLVWMYKEDYDNGIRREYNPKTAPRKVYCPELDTVFESLSEASRQTGVSFGIIGECCKKKRKSAGKHPVTKNKLTWIYYEE